MGPPLYSCHLPGRHDDAGNASVAQHMDGPAGSAGEGQGTHPEGTPLVDRTASHSIYTGAGAAPSTSHASRERAPTALEHERTEATAVPSTYPLGVEHELELRDSTTDILEYTLRQSTRQSVFNTFVVTRHTAYCVLDTLCRHN